MDLEVTTQLSLFLANKPGTLAAVCNALGSEGINIYAFTTSDTVDHTVIRLIVDNPRTAMLMLERRGLLVIETQVLMIGGDNRPGSLAAIATKFAEEGANIEYAYCATPPSSRRGLLVVRPDHVDKALRALNRGRQTEIERHPRQKKSKKPILAVEVSGREGTKKRAAKTTAKKSRKSRSH